MSPLDPKWSLATVSLGGTLDAKLAATAAAGFDAIELCESDLVTCSASPEELRARIGELGLTIALYQPFRDFEAVTPTRFAQNLRRAEHKFELMNRLGARLLLVCSNVSADAIDNDALAAAQLRALADRAARHGIRIAYEALAWGRHVCTSEHAWQIVSAADHPNLGLCLDSFHILADDSDLSVLDGIAADKIFFVQLADAPLLAMDVLQWSRHHRRLPGQGELDLGSFVAWLARVGYGGPMSLEVFNDVIRQTDPAAIAADAMRSLLALERELPRGESVGGFAFVELAVDANADAGVEDRLAALGFVMTGCHRSKPVTLWQHGGAGVVLNYGAPGDPGEADHVRLSALAVESVDPAALADRARALLAQEVPRKRRPDEAILPTISTPDGLELLLCSGHRWRADFARTDGEAGTRAGLELDHVALWEPLETFEETSLFHRAVLDLTPVGECELCTPNGLVRSRVLANDNGLQVVLNGPLVGRGSSSDPELQHVAFCCEDILKVAVTAQERGLEVLPIGDNYYDDLESRFELPDAMLETLRRLSILYDRDPLGGELFHFFTPPLGGRVFFEVLERRRGYRGFGAANAPVRLTAHYAALQLA
jgi:4-hydroxyphenylpyruvate dioxygenase